MAFSRPSLSRLISRVQADIESVLQNGASRLRRAAEYAIGKAVAGMSHGLYGFIEFVSKQVVPSTEMDYDYVVKWAAVFDLEPTPAVPATFTILVTGLAESELEAGTVFTRADGTLFTTDDDVTIPAAPPLEIEATVTASVAGDAGNTAVGAPLTIVTPVTGIDPEALVQGTADTTVGDGADAETGAALLTRLLEVVQTPASGGGPGDYIEWAKEVSGVSRAWELPLQLGPGTVVVLFVQDTFDDDGNFIETVFPGGGQVADVQAVLDANAPVTSVPTALAPIDNPLNPTIALEPNTADVQAAVIVQLNDLLLRRAEPGGTLLLSEINEAISLAVGETDHTLVSPVASVVSEATEIVTIGTPVFQDM